MICDYIQKKYIFADEIYQALLAKDVVFVNQPTDMLYWGMRTVHLRDPEENLIELFTPLKTE